MTSAARYPTIIRTIALIVGAATTIGAVIGLVIGGLSLEAIAQGALTGILIASALTLIQFGILRSSTGERLFQSRFLVHVATKSVVYVVAIVGALLISDYLFSGTLVSGGLPTTRFLVLVLVSLGLALLFSFMIGVNTLLGTNVLANFVTGRYHNPREENRVFLFVDMRGSTEAGERLGSIPFHRLLRRFIYDVGEAAQATHGEIHKYVGDEVIVTWTEAEAADGRPIDCIFRLADLIAERGERYRREFGEVPGFRVGLHGGTVVAGEIGGWKQEIAYIGDAVNTAARIVDICRSTGRQVLASKTTLDRMRVPTGISVESIGQVELRGKAEPMELIALCRS